MNNYRFQVLSLAVSLLLSQSLGLAQVPPGGGGGAGGGPGGVPIPPTPTPAPVVSNPTPQIETRAILNTGVNQILQLPTIPSNTVIIPTDQNQGRTGNSLDNTEKQLLFKPSIKTTTVAPSFLNQFEDVSTAEGQSTEGQNIPQGRQITVSPSTNLLLNDPFTKAELLTSLGTQTNNLLSPQTSSLFDLRFHSTYFALENSFIFDDAKFDQLIADLVSNDYEKSYSTYIKLIEFMRKLHQLNIYFFFLDGSRDHPIVFDSNGPKLNATQTRIKDAALEKLNKIWLVLTQQIPGLPSNASSRSVSNAMVYLMKSVGLTRRYPMK